MTPITLPSSLFFRACMGMGEIFCSSPLATLVTKMGNFVLAPFKALEKLYSLTKSQEKPVATVITASSSDIWESAINNGIKDWVDEELAKPTSSLTLETANKEKITLSVVPPKSFDFGKLVYTSSGTNSDQMINKIFKEKFKREEAEATAVLNNAIAPEEEDDTFYNPNNEPVTPSSPRPIPKPVVTVRVDNKEAKSISPKRQSNWEIPAAVLDNAATYKNIITIRKEAAGNRAKHQTEARLKREKTDAILNKPLNTAESARLKTMGPKNISEKEQLIRRARLPENRQKWAPLVAQAENAPDISEWCYQNSVDEEQLRLWIEYNPQV